MMVICNDGILKPLGSKNAEIFSSLQFEENVRSSSCQSAAVGPWASKWLLDLDSKTFSSIELGALAKLLFFFCSNSSAMMTT